MTKKNIQGTIIRFSLAAVFAFFGLEVLLEKQFSLIYSLSLYSIFNLDNWLFPLISNEVTFKYFIVFGSITMTTLLAIGLFTRAVGLIIATISIIGIITDPFLFYDPLVGLFRSSPNILIAGAAASLIFNQNSVFSLTAKIEKETNKIKLSNFIIRNSLGLYFFLIFLSTFIWISENNVIWSYYFNKISYTIPFLPLPIIATTIGSASILILLNINQKIAATVIALFTILALVIHGLSGYSFLLPLGCCLSLLSPEDGIFRPKTQ